MFYLLFLLNAYLFKPYELELRCNYNNGQSTVLNLRSDGKPETWTENSGHQLSTTLNLVESNLQLTLGNGEQKNVFDLSQRNNGYFYVKRGPPKMRIGFFVCHVLQDVKVKVSCWKKTEHQMLFATVRNDRSFLQQMDYSPTQHLPRVPTCL
eukprot:NODE_516_length_6577_cov_0.589379.p6 type:complete len:152 gc:universal NODE_516_length_6577_cov_0.589379:500-45(-)